MGERKETFVYSWWECKLVQPLWKIIWRFLKELKIELSYDQQFLVYHITSNFFSGYNPKGDENRISKRFQKDTCTPMFTEALFSIAKTGRQHKCSSVDKWIKKSSCIYITEYYQPWERRTFCHLQQHEWTVSILC